MKMHLAIYSIFFLLIITLAGCSSVTMQRPLSKPQAIDQSAFEGIWLLDEETVHLRFDTNGTARFAGLEWKDDSFRLVQGEMVVTAGAGYNYLSLRFKEKGAWQKSYHLLQYDFTAQGDLLVWTADVDLFAHRVESGDLNGTVDRDQYGTEVRLTGPPSQILKFLNSSERPLFDYPEPTVLKKIVGTTRPSKP